MRSVSMAPWAIECMGSGKTSFDQTRQFSSANELAFAQDNGLDSEARISTLEPS